MNSGHDGAVPTHAVLLRAINVGGTAKLPMADLRALATELGATDVSTYIASGNLLATPPGDALAFARALESAIESQFGFFRDVIVREAVAIRRARDAHPFTVTNPAFSYVLFLNGAPSGDRVEAARRIPVGGDAWQVEGADLHVRYEKGAGQPELNTDALLRALGVVGTARNLRSVDALLERLSAHE